MRNLSVCWNASPLKRVFGRILLISALAAGFPLFAQIKVISADNLTPFQPRDVGTTSDAKTVRIKLNYARAISSIAVAPGFTEFTAGAVSGCVVDGHTINPALSDCSLDVTFSPKYPGVRTAPLVVTDSAGIKSSVGLVGTGLAPQAALTPGIITTIAGSGEAGYSGDGGPAIRAALNYLQDAQFDSAGNLYIADYNNKVVRKIDTNGIITTVVPSDGSNYINGVTVDAAGNLYYSAGPLGTYIFKMDLNGVVTRFAGGGSGGDGGPASEAALNQCSQLIFDAAGNLYIAEFGDDRIRKSGYPGHHFNRRDWSKPQWTGR